MDIVAIRKQYPQYNDLSDKELADGFHSKYYSDMPKETFYSKVGITDNKDEGIVEGFIKPTAKSIIPVTAHTAASLAQTPISGLAAGAKLISSGGDLNAANKVLEENQQALDEYYLTTPERQQAARNIGIIGKPIEMAGQGLEELVKLTPLKGTIAEPLANTIGQASAIFGAGGAKNSAYKRSGLKNLERIIPQKQGTPHAITPEVSRTVDPAYVKAAFERDQPLALPEGQGFELVGNKPRGFDLAERTPTLEMPYDKTPLLRKLNESYVEQQPKGGMGVPPEKPTIEPSEQYATHLAEKKQWDDLHSGATLYGGIPGMAQFSQMLKSVTESRPAKKLAAFFNPELGVPEGKEWLYSRQKAKGTAALGEKFAEDFVKKYKYLKPEERTAIWEWMDKGTDISTLPENLRKPAQEFKGIDQAMGKFAVANKLMSKETFDAHPNHIRYIYNIHQTGGDFLSGIGQKVNKKFLKERMDLTDQQRAELGLVKDPVQAIATSIGDTYRAVGMTKHFNRIANNPNWVFTPAEIMVDGKKLGLGKAQKILDLYDGVEKHGMKLTPEQIVNRDKLKTQIQDANAVDVPKDYIQINGQQYGSLDGQFVKKEIAQDIKPILDNFKTTSPVVNKTVSGIAAANSLWKMKNVALNIPTAARNTISNPSQLMMSGMRPDAVVVRFVEAIQDLVKNGQYKNEALREGVFKTNFAEGELSEIVQLAKTFDKNNWVDFLSKVQHLGKYYGKIDDVFKLSKFIDERKMGKSRAEAAYQANKWGMDYSLAHPAIKVLRNSPIGAPFLSYQYKIAPLIVESLAKRPWVIASIFALPTLLQPLATQEMTDEDAENYLQSLPEYVKNKQVFLIPGQHGMNALDISYMVPWGNWYQIADSVKDARVSKSFKQLGVASGLLPSVLYGVTTGKDLFTNQDIVSPENVYNKKAAAWDVTKWIWQQAAPPMLTETSVAGKVSEHLVSGQTKKGLPTEGMNVWPRIAGINIYPVDPNGKAKEIRYELNNVRKALMRKLLDRNASQDERRAALDAYRMAVQEIKGAQEEPEERTDENVTTGEI